MRLLPAVLLSLSLALSTTSWASLGDVNKEMPTHLLGKFSSPIKKNEYPKIKQEIFAMGGRSVPVLTEVMKNDKYPDKNRWMATFLLAQLMGDKSAPYISKYSQHPNWLLRMASLKALTALKQKEQGALFAKALKDDALLVRIQALESIKTLGLSEYAPHVWATLYDKRNYYESKGGSAKRGNIIKLAVSTVGDLKFQKARPALLKMVANPKYQDIFPEMDVALTKITGKRSPEGDTNAKRLFWKRQGLNEVII